MLHLICWMIALATYEPGAAEATDWMKPPSWSGNYWGPAATRARSAGNLPPLQSNPEMGRWHRWGREVLRSGDIVFRLGNARVVRGMVPLSRFIARATGSPFSHTGIVAIEDGSPVVYDCSSAGVQRQPFEVWMLDSLGALGVKRLKPEHRERIAGVIDYCRAAFERQVPFDNGFRMEDDSLYCLELTEKAFRSQGLALSEPSPDWRLGVPGELSSDRIADPACKRIGAGSPDHTRAAGLRPRQRAARRVGVSVARNRVWPGAEGVPGCSPGRARPSESEGRSGSPRLHLRRGAPFLRPASRSIALRPGPSDESPWDPSGQRWGATTGEPGK